MTSTTRPAEPRAVPSNEMDLTIGHCSLDRGQSNAAPHGDVIEVSAARLDVGVEKVRLLERHLSTDEMQRAQRLRFERHRRRFIVRRGILRVILAAHCSMAPSELRFSYGRYGKPILLSTTGISPVEFNLAHSGDVAVYAVGTRPLGIDLEAADGGACYDAMVERFLAPGERAQLRALPDPVRGRAFLSCWTRKEAYLKARGEGLALPLNRFEVPVLPRGVTAFRVTASPSEVGPTWVVQDLDLGEDFAAALAILGRPARLVLRGWLQEQLSWEA